MIQPSSRRPLASRSTVWANRAARRLAATGVSPNQISVLGMVFAAIAGAALWGAGGVDGAARVLLLLVGALFTQGRLLCNLFDGMVAIEGGKQAPDGPFWNEFPDRVSDALILVGLAMGVAQPVLGWAIVALAFLTAYLRELGVNCGLPADFSGPMAKPQRMAVVTGAAVLTIFAPLIGLRDEVIHLALWLLAVGTGLTALRRAFQIVQGLRHR